MQTIVIDAGSYSCKAGFSGDDAPCSVFPNVIGRPDLTKPQMISMGGNNVYVGEDALSRKNTLSLRYPTEHGIVTSWDDMEKIWQTLFMQLDVAPEEHNVIVSEAFMGPKANRETLAQRMFEYFSVHALHISLTAVLANYASSGRACSVILESGHGVTQVVPIYQGYALPHAIVRCHVNGADITEYLSNLLTLRGYEKQPTDVVRDIKERLCYFSDNFEEEVMSEILERSYELPDGMVISVGGERYRAAEALFNPSMIGINSPGIHECVFNSIKKCDEEIQKDLFDSIYLSGGNTMIDNLSLRLRREMCELAPPNSKIRVFSAPERKDTAWIGGSILGCLATFRGMCVSKEEYEEHGSSVIHRTF
jgi:actin-related protein